MVYLNEAREFEKKVGIEYFITNTKPLFGLIKYKSSDFIVEEILWDGTVLSLNKPILLNLPNKGDYLYVVVAKDNLSINELINTLTNKLRIERSKIGISGIKDKRAITVQLLSLKGVKDVEISKLRFSKIKILSSSYSFGPLRLGTHLGNFFHVLIRNISLSKDEIKNICDKVIFQLTNSFIPNYFGYQRFGIPRPVTHLIGKYLLLNDFEKAFDYLIGYPDPLEPEEFRIARETYHKTHDVRETLKVLPENLYYEKIALNHLLHHNNDYIGAFSKLPNLALRLFIESYSAYIFNKALSIILKENLINIENGDIVAINVNYNPSSYVFEVGYNISKDNAIKNIEKGKLIKVLPIMGYKVKIGGGIMKELLREILINEGVRQEDFKLRLNNKIIALKGTYRRIDIPFIYPLSYEIREDEIFKNNCVYLSFALPKGIYATIIIREIMKHNFEGAYIGKYSTNVY